MTDRLTVEELERRGAGLPAPEDLRALYREAFHDYGLRALWSSRPVGQPTLADLLAITESLRVEGGRGRTAVGRTDHRRVPCRSLASSRACCG